MGPPKTELVSETVFENEGTANAVLIALYTKMAGYAGHNTNYTMIGGMLADEAESPMQEGDGRQVADNEMVPTNYTAGVLFGEYYGYIYHANVIIEGAANSVSLPDSLRRQLTGEALAMRGFIHYYLAGTFGKLAYITTTDYQQNTKASRLSRYEVMELVIKDLLEAQAMLPDDFSAGGGQRIRINKAAVTGMLARAYLWNKEYEKAAAEASKVIANKAAYQLVPLDDVFLANSKEAIWQLLPGWASNDNTMEGKWYIITGIPGASTVSFLRESFVNAFEAGDQRRAHWVGSYTHAANNTTWYFPYKYKIGYGNFPTREYSMTMRLAEMYLIRAEARAEMNDLGGARADIDTIRARAGLGATPANTKAAVLDVVQHEKRMELFSEWAHRWFDLNRTHRADAAIGPLKDTWQPTDSVFPIPESEVLVNPNMKQNPGY